MDEETKDEVTDDESKSAISADLIRGHINTIILRTLYERDKYGYEIIEEIEKKSHGQYTLKQPTLYSALKRLESQGYINAYWKTDEVSLGGRRKYYTLTDSGREITEKNQAEWEYSRTVIDNLISDRSFDFTQPPPATSVDFKILKKSTTRVPVVKDEDDDDEPEEKPAENKTEHVIQTVSETVIQPVEVRQTVIQQPAEVKETVIQPVEVKETVVTQPAEVKQAVQETKPVEPPVPDEEQRRIVHENYLRLISEPLPEKPKEVDEVPLTEGNNIEQIIYTNKPETEKDYRNLINNLFDKTVHRKQESYNRQIVEPTPVQTVKVDDINVKADTDGLKVNSSQYIINSRKKSYNRGSTLFKCSLIVSIILVLEFTICMLFRKDLGVSLAYPFVIIALAIAQLGIFGVLYYTDLGKTTRKPSSTAYLTVCVIVTVILIFIIFIISLLLNVRFASAGDIMAKIIIPCILALNIPVFAVCFYYFSK